MEVVNTKVVIDCEIHIKLTYQEAAALVDIVRYGAKPFLEHFKARMGKHYISQHESGVETLFPKIYNTLPAQLSKVDEARKVVQDMLVKKLT